ncbi:MAG: hypothetical protein M3Y93_07025 [Pseudomonadota bacterium]|nr:hypothetical protein [Pseudomonadota bacterium]
MAPINERIETVAVGPGAAVHSRISWGAIFAGWLVATAVAGLLYLAGLALGFAAFDPYATHGAMKGIGVGTAIWLIGTWAAGLFVGGMFASWFDGKSDQTSGAIHGVAVWGLSLTAAAVWMMLGLGQAMHHHDPVGQGDHPAMHAMHAAAATQNDALLVLQANVHQMTRNAGSGPRADSGNDDAVVGSILADRMDTARALLMADGVAAGEIDQVLPRLRTEAVAANAQLKSDADQAAHYTSLALWVAFLSGLLALIGAALGGWVGSSNVHRVYHLRRYADRPYPGV